MLENKKGWFAKLLAWGLGTSFSVKAEEMTTSSTKFWAGFTTFFGAFSVNEWGVICGIVLGIASFILSWHFKSKNHKLLRDRVERSIIEELNQ
ncbi:HP1 family phage holin [Vibrio echinoideorum]|uniref:HP1 family phage holin n=1 Tax=Vibrio echinoideorum TaxID=2100116 RepID=UPI0035546761